MSLQITGSKTIGKRSNADRVKDRRANNAGVQAIGANDRNGRHFRVLIRPTLKGHDNVKQHYKDYFNNLEDQNLLTETWEIIMGSKAPSLGEIFSALSNPSYFSG